MQEPNLSHDGLKTLPSWDKCVRVLWDCVRK